VYFPGDTDLFEGMTELAGADVALLPVWGWGPNLGRGHLDPGRAAEAAALLRPRLAVPIHWGTLYPAGLRRVLPRPLADPGDAFVEAVARRAADVIVRVLRPGESLRLEP
jgi:L-ascorbate metabolism protein UlaG (beta-lactamase superfamily)